MVTRLRQVSAGQPIEFSAREWNAIGEAVSLVNAIRLKLDALKANLPASLVVQASNGIGSDLPLGGIGQINASVPAAASVTAGFLELPTFTLAAPSGATGTLAIALEPVANGKAGRAIVTGLAIVKITHATAQGYAESFDADTAKLRYAGSGRIKVITSAQLDATTDMAVVILGGGGGGAAAPSAEVAKVVALGSGYSYSVRQQDWNPTTSAFVDRPGTSNLSARNVAEIGVGPGQMVDVGTYVVLHTMGSIYVFSHPVFAKYKD